MIEEALFGCHPFAIDQHPSWDEAADRLIYVAHNMRQFDTGSSPGFGDVTAVFDTRYVHDMVLIAPMDTGLYWSCHDPSSHHHTGSVNCSAWQPEVVGTLDHFDHLILPNFAYWYNTSTQNKTLVDGAVQLFSHSAFAGNYEDLPPADKQSLMAYWESNVLGNPRLEGGVKFLIGNFPTLFGTDDGRQLQRLADHYSWPLFWAFGYGSASSHSHGHSGPLLGNERLIDPEMASKVTNVTVPTDSISRFDEIWATASQARKLDSNITADQFAQWWSALKDTQVRVAPVSASSCSNFDGCVGTVVGSGDCVCRIDPTLLVV